MASVKRRNQTKTQKSPASVTPGTTVHSGYLNKLSGRAFLYPGSWKKKYCVLDSQRLFFFNSKEDEAACVANPERISSYINLEYYDSCEEAAAKEVRKASNVFVVSSSDKSFFESGRYYFSAETLPEMNEWINQIRLVMESLRTKGSPLAKQTVKKTTANPPAAAVVNKETNKDVPSIKEETTVPAPDDYVTPDLEEVTSGAERLDCMTRQRAKGPAGRRLPRQRFTTVDGSPALNGREQRSGSLSLLDSEEAEQNRAPLLHNRSFDVSAIGEEAYWSLPPAGVSFKPVYAYSSSDESLNASFSSAVTENEKKKVGEKKSHDKVISDRPILTGKRSGKAAAKAAPPSEPEAVDTLAEEPKLLHSSTPSLPLVLKPTNWLGIGSSSTAPSVVRQKHRTPARSVITLAQMEATWTRQGNCVDTGESAGDAHPADSLGEQLRGALEQIHGLRATLALLESDSAGARRDMGSLQENLTTVQSAAASAAEKVARMQTQVNNIERQVSSAVKEAQNVQQKANEALAAATAAERDFRSLEDQCRTLLAELRRKEQAKDQTSKVADEEIPDTLDETRPPLTPNFSIGSLVSSSTISAASNCKPSLVENDQARPLPLSNGFLSLQPTSFDFASILSAKGSNSSLEAPKIKSALKSDGKASAKSISFGPTTTFQDPSSPLLAPDVSNPFATSTLRKVAPKIQTSDN